MLDKNIKFIEDGHKYIISTDPNSKYTSVTTFVHSHFPHFDADSIINSMMKSKGWKEGHKYWGMTPEQIKTQWSNNGTSVSSAGTNLHYEIECFNNDKRYTFKYSNKELYEIYMSDNCDKIEMMSLEWKYFLNFVKDQSHLIPYRTEWMIFDDEYKIAGSIDMVYENPDGTLSIYDWKRSKGIIKTNNFNKFAITPIISHLPDTNFWHYALQLNTYKFILERKYGKTIKDLYLVRLHPDTDEKNYELIKLPDLTKEVIDLFEERKQKLE
jgi:ATP-dependent exoDNAse (exonuclease V) beta subunit